jgi:hypothetical protein
MTQRPPYSPVASALLAENTGRGGQAESEDPVSYCEVLFESTEIRTAYELLDAFLRNSERSMQYIRYGAVYQELRNCFNIRCKRTILCELS